MSKGNQETTQTPAEHSASWVDFQAVTWEQLPDLGLYMDQVITYVEQHCRSLYRQQKFLTPAMVNNYVKIGLLTRPDGKKYGRMQLAQLMMICTLKQALSQDEMKRLLAPMRSTTDTVQTEHLYHEFCDMQEQVWKIILSRNEQYSPMHAALEAAANRILCGDLIARQEKP